MFLYVSFLYNICIFYIIGSIFIQLQFEAYLQQVYSTVFLRYMIFTLHTFSNEKRHKGPVRCSKLCLSFLTSTGTRDRSALYTQIIFFPTKCQHPTSSCSEQTI